MNEPARPPEGPTPRRPGPPANPNDVVVKGFGWAVYATRLLVLIPAIVLLVSGLGAFAYGTAYFIHAVGQLTDDPYPVQANLGVFLIDLDLFLIGATLLLIAVGFYGLAVGRGGPGEDSAIVPEWLDVRDLEDMKTRIIAMLVLVSVTSFVDVVVDFHSGPDILYLGGGIAVIIVAATAFLRFGVSSRHQS